MALRNFRNGPATTLIATISQSDAIITVADASGFPTFTPYTLIIDEGQGTEEVVDVTAVAGNQLTISRGVDGTTAFPHSSGAVVVHGISARDAREANTHVNSNSAVHGVNGSLVGTTDVQTLSSKTLTSSSFQGGSVNTSAISGGTISGARIQDVTVIQPNSATSNNPISLRDTAGVERGFINRELLIQGSGLRAFGTNPATTTLLVRSATGQTADIVDVRTVSDTRLLVVNSAGRVGINTGGAPSGIGLHLKGAATNDITLRLATNTGQTSRVFQIVDDGNTEVFGVSAEGNFRATNFEGTAWATYSPGFTGSGAPSFVHTGRWKRIGTNVVAFNVQVTFSSAGAGTTPCTFNLPTPPARNVRQAFVGHSDNPGAALTAVTSTSDAGSTINRILLTTSAAFHNLNGSDIENGTILTFSGVYEEA